VLAGLGRVAAGRWWAPLVAFGVTLLIGVAIGVMAQAEPDESGVPALAMVFIFSMYGGIVAAAVAAGVLVRVVFAVWIRWAGQPEATG
jgi:hypothetical protein